MLKTAHINILESSSVTLTAGTEDTDHPLYRLYDRNIGRVFRPAAAETVEVKVDQGAGAVLAVDRLFIPEGHNLAGMTLDISHSDDDAMYTPAVAQWSGAAGLIERSWEPVAKRYWKFVITAPAAVPELAELFLSAAYAWERGPARPAGPLEEVFNVQNEVTAGGQDRFLVHGAPKRRRDYRVPHCGEAQKDAMLALNAAWAASRPFWLWDHTRQWIYGKLAGPLDLIEVAYRQYAYDFNFLEVLP